MTEFHRETTEVRYISRFVDLHLFIFLFIGSLIYSLIKFMKHTSFLLKCDRVNKILKIIAIFIVKP